LETSLSTFNLPVRHIRTTAKLILVWLFVILMTASQTVAQSKAEGISIALSVSSTEFARGTKPRARVTIRNHSGSPISLKSFGQLLLTLELKDRPYEFCRISECYNAVLFPPDKVVPNDGSVSLVAKLYDVYWHNTISSIRPEGYPKNLFASEPGESNLFAELRVRADNWTAKDPRFVGIKSNVVSPVTISKGK
jgi:hypothetical protein